LYQRNKYGFFTVFKSSTLDDSLIISSFADENKREKAFRALVEKYQQRVYFLIRKMVASHDDADDLTQETFLKVWKNLHKFREDAKLFTWIYRIAANEALQFLRKKKLQNLFSYEKVSRELAAVIDTDPSFSGDEIEKDLHKALQKLPEKQKLVFSMRYFDEMPYKEMSEILGTSEGALKASYHHAVKKIESEIRQTLLQAQ